jgi:uncharacterized integral membrane protein
MFSLIILFIFGFMAAIFAVQNTQSTSIQFGQYGFTAVPLFAVVIAAALFGVFVSWLISLTGNIAASMSMRGKEGQIHKLEDRVHELELENERLRGEDRHETHDVEEPEEHRRHNPFVKIRQRFS